MKIFRILLMAFLVETVTAQHPTPASLEGIVVQDGTNFSLAAATVELRSETGQSIAVTTDRDGHFIIPNVKPGHYRLLASKSGFARAEYGVRPGGAFWEGRPLGVVGPGAVQQWQQGRPSSQGVTAAAGTHLSGLRIVMTPGAAISGRVFVHGKAAANLVVSAARISYDTGGRAVLSKFLSGETDDRGEYHIFWLPPGRYFVMAELSDSATNPTGQPAAAAPSVFVNPTDGGENPLISRFNGQGSMLRGGGDSPLLFVSLRSEGINDSEMRMLKYFPDKSDWHDATPVEVRGGDERRNIDINGDAVPALHIKGKIDGVPLDAKGVPVGTQITVLGLASPLNQNFARDSVDSANTFDIARIPPGHYVLNTQAGNRRSRIPVDVSDRDVSVNVTLDSGVTISGRVVSEMPDIVMNSLTVGLVMETVDALRMSRRPAADGSFSITDVLPGQNYRVFVSPVSAPLGDPAIRVVQALQNVYVKSIALANTKTDVLNDGLDVTSQSPPLLLITLGANAGSFDGHVGGGPQSSGATVVLIPNNAQKFHVLHKYAYADEKGHFQILGVPPGDYTVYAWDLIEPFAWQNPEFMRAYESQGMPVHFDEGKNVSGVELQLIR